MSAADDFADSLLAGFDKPAAPTEEAPAPAPHEAFADSLMADIDKQATTPKSEPKQKETPPDASTKSFEGNTISLAIPLPGMTDKRFDTGIPMPASAGKAFAQFGSGLTDIGLGLDQAMGKATNADADAKRRMDDPLNKGFWGTVNNMAGRAAPFVAGAAGALPFAGSAPAWMMTAAPIAYGGAQGYVEPVETHGPGRGLNTAIGALTAGLGPAAHKIFGLGEDKIAGPLAREAADLGYKVTPGDANTQGITGFIRDKMGGVPIVGQRQGVREANQAKFGEQVAKTWGGSGGSIHPEQFAKDGDALKTQITGMYKNNPLTITNQFEKKLEAIGTKVAASDTGRNEVKKITDEIAGARVFDKKTGTYTADGEKIQTVLENLEARMRGDPKSEMNKVRQNLYDTIKTEYTKKMKPEDAKQLAESLQHRKAWDAMKGYIEKTGAGEAGRSRGQLSPEDVAAAARAMGTGSNKELNRAAEIGQHMLRPTGRVPNFGASIPNLVGSTALTGAAAGPSALINSPMMYNIGKHPIVAGALKRAGSPVTRPLAVQGALSATEGYAHEQQRGREMFSE
jgi:hypothetical protein